MLVDRGPQLPASACKFAEKAGHAGQGRLGGWPPGCFAGVRRAGPCVCTQHTVRAFAEPNPAQLANSGINCSFLAPQVWNVQTAGARGAIVVNYEDKMTTMEAPDEDDEANLKYLTCVSH